MVHAQTTGSVAPATKCSSERDDDDRDGCKRRPPPQKPSPEAVTFRPHRCRKCRIEGKKGRKYRSFKGLREHCVVHHSCTYHAVADRYVPLTSTDCRRQLATIQAGRRHRPVAEAYFAPPPSHARGRGVRRYEATPTAPTSAADQSTATASTRSVEHEGASDSRNVVLHPNRLPCIYSDTSSDSSDSSGSSDSSESLLPAEFAECCGPAVPSSPVQQTPSAAVAASVPPLVEPTVSSVPVDTPSGQTASKLNEPSASPFVGCLPMVVTEKLSIPGSRLGSRRLNDFLAAL